MKKIICKLFCFFIGCLFSFCCYSGVYSTSLIPSSTVSNSNPAPTSKFVTVTTNRPAISNEQYNTLPACPQTISGCPDINGLFNGQAVTTPPASCPDSCTVTRSPAVLNGQSQTNYVGNITVTDPTCPTGYASVGTFNVQNEAVYSANPATIKPINGMTNYNNYVNAGYSCTTYGSQQTSGEYCSGQFTDGQITASASHASGNVVWIQNSYRSSCHCGGSCASCACWAAGTGPNWTYRYYYIQCTPPAGVYLTGSQVPVSLVCARVKSAWGQ